MYLESLKLINAGPVAKAEIVCEFSADGTPKPILIVGRNGSGKSLALAHIVSAITSAHAESYDDSDIEKGKVLKLRTNSYIRHGADYSVGEVRFTNGYFVNEIQLAKPKSEYEAGYLEFVDLDMVPAQELMYLSSNSNEPDLNLKDSIDSETHLYFPPNRFEEPAWLNDMNLKSKADYPSLRRFVNLSNRSIIVQSPMKDIQNWLLDIIYDSFAVERNFFVLPPFRLGDPVRTFEERNGQATSILNAIEQVVKKVFGREGQVQWRVGQRNSRRIGLAINEETIAENLFGLSTGQALLIDLFLSIIRDFDLSKSTINTASDIKGIVVVDEIDLHLHTDMQHDVLPEIMRLFPGVQFIVTTHSPLFIMGMQGAYTKDSLQVIEFPDGVNIEAERFSEFESAYHYMARSALFQRKIQKRVRDLQRPTLFLEGATDVAYLLRAGELLGFEELLSEFELFEAAGSSNLSKIWDTYKGHLNYSVTRTLILLYDCDAAKSDDQIGNLIRRSVPAKDRKVRRGIENLFANRVIEAAMEFKPAFVDIVGAHQKTERGKTVDVPEIWEVNKDEKKNLCDWICSNASDSDFLDFKEIFQLIESILP